MDSQRTGSILTPILGRGVGLLTLLLTMLLLSPLAAAAGASDAPIPALSPLRQSGPEGPTPLEARRASWPVWHLPAPLSRPGNRAPAWPDWFAGEWVVHSVSLGSDSGEAGHEDPPWRARFVRDKNGRVVADRACNAAALGRALFGEALLGVRDDPRHPLRQLSRFRDGQLLETTLVAARTEVIDAGTFLNDELSLQVLHGPVDPQLNRVETLGRWQRRADGGIDGEQWQARYRSPGEGLIAEAQETAHFRLSLDPPPPGSGPAS
jgi:hypothetical protein